ncbi:hypothetical protein BN1723_004924 [Verticillium longisporum]|uniref:Uncharacterized protein n=1 Tax=Verticillium longisporum TaxID=100787 RepID=A0A0G4N3C7_VERLO|nr:hypothetical protein BN1708_004653 [Verticillium longisporum]CRK40810.1 hypothetical protein BN1723_004924 [Verticillium longisporum]
MAAQVESGIATALVTRRSSSTTARQGSSCLPASRYAPFGNYLTHQRSAKHLPNCPPQGGGQAHTARKRRPIKDIHHHPPSPTSRSSGQRFLSRFLSFPPFPVNGAQAQPAARHWEQRHNPPHNDNAFMNLSPSVDTRLPPAACLLWGMAPCEPSAVEVYLLLGASSDTCCRRCRSLFESSAMDRKPKGDLLRCLDQRP